MGLIVDTTDFSSGKYKVSQSIHTDLALYIARYEKQMLVELLGAELATLYIADLTNKVPVTAKYLSLHNAFFEDDGDKIRSSSGVKDMLLGFIWFEYTRDLVVKNTINGLTKNLSEASEGIQFTENVIYQFYNEAVRTHNTIQWYIDEHATDYLEYNGQCKQITGWAL